MPLGRRTAADYGDPERLRAAAEPLKGARVLHLAAAGSRLRSPNLMPSLLSLYGDLGVHAEYNVLVGADLTRQLEDGLLGGETAISESAWTQFVEDSPTPTGYDVVVAHGPGPLASASKAGAPCLLRCELDCSNAEAATWGRLQPLARAIAVPKADYAPPGIQVHELPEAIDPLAPGSIELPVKLAGSLLRARGIDLTRPLCFHEFDAWQDSHAVVDASTLPGLQLVLVGDEWDLLRELSEYAQTADGARVLRHVGDVEMNALRALSRAGVESPLAGGSELARLETWWKGTPVVEADPSRIDELVGDPGLAIELGAEGRQRVREQHLITHLAENELRLLASFQSP
jgi:trehalose synthase